jgi:hypothetical protein
VLPGRKLFFPALCVTITLTSSFLGEARSATKMGLRGPTLKKLLDARQEDTKSFIDFNRKDSTQKMLAFYMKKLAEKSKSKM